MARLRTVLVLALAAAWIAGCAAPPAGGTQLPTLQEEATLPSLAPPQAPTDTAEPAAEGTEVRRLELAPTPTVFQVTEDDVRSILDLAHPDGVDYFDTQGTWFDFDTTGVAAYRMEDGHLLGIDYQPEELYTYWSYTDRSSGNTYAEVSITNGDCINKDSAGLVIRVDSDTASEGYALDVSCDGNWRFRQHRRGQEPFELVEWQAASVIQTGKDATNRLGIWGYAGRFVLFINGAQVGEVVDQNNSYTYGQFAVYVRASQTFDLTATFDDFAFWHIPFIP
jgi:hypothetical protein